MISSDQSNSLAWTWSDDHIKPFLEKAPKHLHLSLMLALWTGQRQGELADATVVGL